jgi:hypothetical protein
MMRAQVITYFAMFAVLMLAPGEPPVSKRIGLVSELTIGTKVRNLHLPGNGKSTRENDAPLGKMQQKRIILADMKPT